MKLFEINWITTTQFPIISHVYVSHGLLFPLPVETVWNPVCSSVHRRCRIPPPRRAQVESCDRRGRSTNIIVIFRGRNFTKLSSFPLLHTIIISILYRPSGDWRKLCVRTQHDPSHSLLTAVSCKSLTVKGEGKVVPVPFFNGAPRHKGVLGSGGIAPRILWPRHCMGCECSASRLGSFTPREKDSGTHWIGGWVGPSSSGSLHIVNVRSSPTTHNFCVTAPSHFCLPQ
jgi:hypothetical protein